MEQPIEQPSTSLVPISAGERFVSVDALRGFALLGIFVMNIPTFALSNFSFFDPSFAGGFTGRNYAIWLGAHLVFDMKMQSLFSMLFGAGLGVMAARADARGSSLRGVYYRRTAWLLVFGLVHAYFIWFGDILYAYAVCGMLIYPLRRLSPRWLLAIGLGLFLVGAGMQTLTGVGMGYMKSQAEAAQSVVDAGEAPTPAQTAAIDTWKGISEDFTPTPELVAKEQQTYAGGYRDLFLARAKESLFMQVGIPFWTFSLPRFTGYMLMGLALLRLGVFTAARSTGFYAALAVIGYAVSIPAILLGVAHGRAANWDFVDGFRTGWHYNYLASLPMALAHTGVIMLLCKSGALRWLTTGLAAVGRMAITNYLMHSLIGSLIFYPYGFGLWGKLDRTDLALVVLGVWALQLLVSPWWLARFRFGPMEWLWRSLTYKRMQPMRAAPNAVY